MSITLYSTHCPKCMVLEKKLQSKNLEFDIVEGPDAIIEKGYMSAPLLEVDGKTMDFKEANDWINEQE